MSDLHALLADRLAASAAEPFFELSISTAALQWLCSSDTVAPGGEVGVELRELEYVLDGELTPAGDFVRHVTTRSDRQLLLVRAQRGPAIRTLECFADDDLVLAVDDSSDRDSHAIGYVSTTDVVNVIARWVGIAPLDGVPERDFDSTLGELLARATSDDGDVTLYSIATEDSLMLDIARIDGVGYFHVEAGPADTGTDAELIPVTVTSVSGYNVYLMLVDALAGPPPTD